MEKIEPTHYQLPAAVFEQVFKFLTQYPWYQVNEIINLLRTNAVPITIEKPKVIKEIAAKKEEKTQ